MGSPMMFLFLLVAFARGQNTSVFTQLGRLDGIITGGVRSFSGIPYAEPPVRFAPSVAKRPWKGALDATKIGPACIQPLETHPNPPSHSEDCLFANVWAPLQQKNLSSSSSSSPPPLLPVMVYIHGGSFASGAGSDYNASKFARSGTVVVTINYRLNIFGFLPLREIRDTYGPNGGLNGIGDQIIALKWVKANIVSFGGDPSRVTVAGESAGGLSVCILNTSPAAASLFNQMIILSGSCTGPWGVSGTSERGMERGLTAVNKFNLKNPSKPLVELQKFSANELLEKYLTISTLERESLLSADEAVLLQTTTGGLNTSHATRAIIGNTNLDGLFAFTAWLPFSAPSNKEKFIKAVNLYYNTTGANAALTSAYGVEDTTPIAEVVKKYVEMNGDVCLICPAKDLLSQLHTIDPRSTTYLYSYHKNPGQHIYKGDTALHSSELNYLFGYPLYGPNQPAFPVGPWTVSDQSFADNFFQYFNSFVQTGDPNFVTGLSKEKPSLNRPVWQPWLPDTRVHLILDTNITTATELRSQFCSVLEATNASFETNQEFCFQKNGWKPPKSFE